MALFFFLTAQSQNKDLPDVGIIPKIVVKAIGVNTDIQGIIKNDSNLFKTLSSELIIISNMGAKNASKAEQKDNFSIAPDEVKIVATKNINVADTDNIIVLFLIYEDEKLIARDRKELRRQKNDPNVSDGLEIKGLVVENVRSKVGKDFYDYFYQQFTLKNPESDQLVKVEEQLGIGIGTRIQIKVQEDLVFESFARPNEEQLVNLANSAVARVLQYFKQKERQKQLLRQF
ncbi:CsgE family curli-type amyloid fiber assembly protein [Spongiivirga sp. MCCC 1A20706]|uniref:CsgE family curli-type amyloid fiber assembly protein n=1 Tax=Spongiivirga sp. MCCC 1A20706 TaxID=3160963 RepID=UPI003977BB16